jgi:hypothetical protein
MDARERAKRKHKDQRVAKGRLDEMQGVTETQIVDGKRLAALPVNLSDLIIVGDVLNGYAYLSSNKTGLFSEFAVSIVDVLKGMRGDTVKAGTRISIEREGGSIRYPSGFCGARARTKFLRYSRDTSCVLVWSLPSMASVHLRNVNSLSSRPMTALQKAPF